MEKKVLRCILFILIWPCFVLLSYLAFRVFVIEPILVLSVSDQISRMEGKSKQEVEDEFGKFDYRAEYCGAYAYHLFDNYLLEFEVTSSRATVVPMNRATATERLPESTIDWTATNLVYLSWGAGHGILISVLFLSRRKKTKAALCASGEAEPLEGILGAMDSAEESQMSAKPREETLEPPGVGTEDPPEDTE